MSKNSNSSLRFMAFDIHKVQQTADTDKPSEGNKPQKDVINKQMTMRSSWDPRIAISLV